MAHLVKPWVVRWTDPKTGKRVTSKTPGAKSHTERSKKWYGVGIPGQGTKRVPLAADKKAAARMLDDLVRRAELGQAGVPDQEAGRRRLADQLDDFDQDVRHGLAARGTKKKRPDDRQARLTVNRVRDVLDGCEFRFTADLGDDAPRKLSGYLAWRVGLTRAAGGISHQTAAFYLAAARRFVWWLATRKKAPVRADLFNDVPGFEPDNNRKHARRNIPADDLARVLESARGGPEAEGLAGEARYFLYLTAFSTGFRSSELASLTPAHFDLDAAVPTVRLAGKVAKNRKAVTQPLPPPAAAAIAGFLAGKPADQPLWPGKWTLHGARMLRVDLAAANVPYRIDGPNGAEYADFHSLRHSFLSALAAVGTGAKVLQLLARHSTARLTLERYTHADAEQLAGAVARLPVGGADPLGHLTRDQLVALVVAQAAVLGCLFPPARATRRATGPGNVLQVLTTTTLRPPV